jgi:epsin
MHMIVIHSTISQHVNKPIRPPPARIKTHTDFQYINPETGKDEGLNVREKAKGLVDLLGNPGLLKFERDKARANKNKYVGISAQDGPGGGGGGGNKYVGGWGVAARFICTQKKGKKKKKKKKKN